jgi:DNA-binding transcriptional regulator YiaG
MRSDAREQKRKAVERALGKAIFEARRTTRLTQEELATRIGVRVQALSLWESGRSVPRDRNYRALIRAISALDAEAGAELTRAVSAPSITPAPVLAASSAPPPPDADRELNLTILELSDTWGLSSRIVRAGLVQLLGRVQSVGLSLEAAKQKLEDRMAAAEADTRSKVAE